MSLYITKLEKDDFSLEEGAFCLDRVRNVHFFVMFVDC